MNPKFWSGLVVLISLLGSTPAKAQYWNLKQSIYNNESTGAVALGAGWIGTYLWAIPEGRPHKDVKVVWIAILSAGLSAQLEGAVITLKCDTKTLSDLDGRYWGGKIGLSLFVGGRAGYFRKQNASCRLYGFTPAGVGIDLSGATLSIRTATDDEAGGAGRSLHYNDRN